MDRLISHFLSQKNFKQLAFDLVAYYPTLKSKVAGILSPKTLASTTAALQEGKLKDVDNIIQKSLLDAENASLDVAVIGNLELGNLVSSMPCQESVTKRRGLLRLELWTPQWRKSPINIQNTPI